MISEINRAQTNISDLPLLRLQLRSNPHSFFKKQSISNKCYSILPHIALGFHTAPIGDKIVICDKSGKNFIQHSFNDKFKQIATEQIKKCAIRRAMISGAKISQLKALFVK
ncbi:hypothetical protein [Bartonella heixiaziensis]|uniref:hypothetical protein n=1 Tax=Bartonella heixiaziensis TaxID=1461000 RepID=UPI003D1BA8A9